MAAAAIVAVPSVALAGDAHQDKTQAAKQAIKGGKARNVILLIGDGMGDSEITIARNYQVGAAGRLAMDTLPLTGAYTTYAVQKDNPALPEYVTDSAASEHRLGDRPQDLQRGHLGAAERQAGPDDPRAGQGLRLPDRQRDHRRAAGRHPGRPRRARGRPQLQGPGRDGHLRGQRQG